MPQPVDPNTEFGRMTAAERIQEISGRVNIAAQLRLAAEAAAAQGKLDAQVMETEGKSEEVDEEARRKNPFAGRRRKPASQGKTRDKKKNDGDGEIHRLDIKV